MTEACETIRMCCFISLITTVHVYLRQACGGAGLMSGLLLSTHYVILPKRNAKATVASLLLKVHFNTAHTTPLGFVFFHFWPQQSSNLPQVF